MSDVANPTICLLRLGARVGGAHTLPSHQSEFELCMSLVNVKVDIGKPSDLFKHGLLQMLSH